MSLVRATGREVSPTGRCYWVVQNQLLAGAYPSSADAHEQVVWARALWDAGVRTFVNLMETHETNNQRVAFAPYFGPIEALAGSSKHELQFLRFPIRDLQAPSADLMRQIVDAIDASIAAGRPVYLHCFGGVGRTATAVCAWLLHRRLATAANVFEVLGELRRADRGAGKRPAPESPPQMAFVNAWAARSRA